MATTRTSNQSTEWCYSCERETRHTVRVELWAENPDSDNAAYSREPYRVSACEACGARRAMRMNAGNSKPDSET